MGDAILSAQKIFGRRSLEILSKKYYQNTYEVYDMEEVWCGCVGGATCDKSIMLSRGQYDQIKKDGNLIIIDGCPNGLFKGDKVVEFEKGFQIVKSIS